MANRASIKDIAEAVGVSSSTVSRAINGKSCVNEETRQKILAMAAQTNYQPNVLAKSLKIGRSNTICLVIPSIENLIFPAITRGVEDIARKRGFTVTLCNTGEDDAVEKSYIEKMKNRWVDGFVLCTGGRKNENAHVLRAEGFPVVVVNRFDEDEVDLLDTVSVDNYAAAYSATRYLIRSGRKRIALVCGTDELLLYRERRRGYWQALKDAGLPCEDRLILYEVPGNENMCFYQMTKDLMARPNAPDAFFCTSDPKAFVVMHALHDLGISIPEQVSVLGFDDVSLSEMVEPPLSTVAQPLYSMGTVAAEGLIRQIQYKEKNGVLPPPVHSVLHVRLIIRRSTN